jgi:hypothetical protein
VKISRLPHCWRKPHWRCAIWCPSEAPSNGPHAQRRQNQISQLRWKKHRGCCWQGCLHYCDYWRLSGCGTWKEMLTLFTLKAERKESFVHLTRELESPKCLGNHFDEDPAISHHFTLKNRSPANPTIQQNATLPPRQKLTLGAIRNRSQRLR